MTEKPSILLWCGSGANQIALANKLHNSVGLAGIIQEKRTSSQKRTFRQILEKIAAKVLIPTLDGAWSSLMYKYSQAYPALPSVQTLVIENINSQEAYSFSENLKPDIVLVSGTRLVKEQMLNLRPTKGILNLHTGLSPYVKGGPNCTNWCLATQQIHLIGNTIMWIDLGIDSGNLVATELVPLTGEEDLSGLHWKVMEHAHTLYLKACQLLISHPELVPNIPQNTIGKGKTYYTKQWNFWQQLRAVSYARHFKKLWNNPSTKQNQQSLQLVALPSA